MHIVVNDAADCWATVHRGPGALDMVMSHSPQKAAQALDCWARSLPDIVNGRNLNKP